MRLTDSHETGTATRIDIVRAAMSLLGTPFVHQGRMPGAGLDCIGVVVATAQLAGLRIRDMIHYARAPNPRVLLREAEQSFDKLELGQEGFGDVGLTWLNPALAGLPHHAFVMVPPPNGSKDSNPWMVHALRANRRVVHNPWADPWKQATHSFWRFKGLQVSPWQQ